ncbi:MAG TPA: hypothetical protein VF457_04285, partial [Burkholderiaceae bacterium]
LTRDWGDGVYTISTPRTRAALGWIGGRDIELGDVDIRMHTRSASVAVQSLDDQPVASARALLVSIGTRSEPTPPNRSPYLSEAAAGTITVRAAPGLKAFEILGDRETPRPVGYREGRYVIELDGRQPVHWIELRRGGRAGD